jgi:hypothetical protein
MDGSAEKARGTTVGSRRAWRMVAVLVDTLLAVAVAASGLAAAMAIVVMLAEARVMPYLSAVSETAAVVLFWAFELLVLAHFTVIAPVTAGGVSMACLLSRRGILPAASPGAQLLRAVRRPAGA